MKDFNFVIPLKKNIGPDADLIGIASTLSIDRDEERMSDKALSMMVNDIKRSGVNLFGNHEHNWENTLGFIKDADLIENQVKVKITLDEANTNPKVPMLLNKLKRGIKLGLSVGGTVTKDKWEYDKSVGKKVRILDEVKIYEVSVVGVPSNADAFVSIPNAINKSANLYNNICPVCFDLMKGVKCNMCQYQKDYGVNCLIGMKVKVGEKLGEIMEDADKRYYIKFDDGSGEWVNEGEFEPVVIDTRLKSAKIKNVMQLSNPDDYDDMIHNAVMENQPEENVKLLMREKTRLQRNLKTATEFKLECPFCKGNSGPVSKNNDTHIDDSEKVYQCYKCGQRFSQDKYSN